MWEIFTGLNIVMPADRVRLYSCMAGNGPYIAGPYSEVIRDII